jgi:hypothetical protein
MSRGQSVRDLRTHHAVVTENILNVGTSYIGSKVKNKDGINVDFIMGVAEVKVRQGIYTLELDVGKRTALGFYESGTSNVLFLISVTGIEPRPYSPKVVTLLKCF